MPRSFHVSQSCGRHTAAVRAAFSGSWVASQRSFVAVIDATGTCPSRRPRLRAQLGHQVGGALRRAGVVPQQRGPHDLAARRPGTPCRAAGPPPRSLRRPRGRPPAPGGLQRVPPARRVDLGAGGCGARPDRTCSPVVGVADDDGAGLRRRVDPGYQAHDRHASASARRVGVRIGGSSRPQARRRPVLVPGVLGSGGNAACGRLGRRVAWRTFRAEALVRVVAKYFCICCSDCSAVDVSLLRGWPHDASTEDLHGRVVR